MHVDTVTGPEIPDVRPGARITLIVNPASTRARQGLGRDAELLLAAPRGGGGRGAAGAGGAEGWRGAPGRARSAARGRARAGGDRPRPSPRRGHRPAVLDERGR